MQKRLRSEQEGMSPKNEEGKVQIHWRRVAGEPSAAWQRLWMRLLQKKGDGSSTADNCKTTKDDKGVKGEFL